MKAFERAAAVGIKVLGVSSGPDFGGVRVDAASFDRTVACFEALRDLLRDEQNDEQSDLGYDHLTSRRYAALQAIRDELRTQFAQSAHESVKE